MLSIAEFQQNLGTNQIQVQGLWLFDSRPQEQFHWQNNLVVRGKIMLGKSRC